MEDELSGENIVPVLTVHYPSSLGQVRGSAAVFLVISAPVWWSAAATGGISHDGPFIGQHELRWRKVRMPHERGTIDLTDSVGGRGGTWQV